MGQYNYCIYHHSFTKDDYKHILKHGGYVSEKRAKLILHEHQYHVDYYNIIYLVSYRVFKMDRKNPSYMFSNSYSYLLMSTIFLQLKLNF